MKWEYEVLSTKMIWEMSAPTPTFPDTVEGKKAREEHGLRLTKQVLNRLGQERWELVGVGGNGACFLKRLVKE